MADSYDNDDRYFKFHYDYLENHDGKHVVTFPRLPRVIGVGDTKNEAVQSAQNGLFIFLNEQAAIGAETPTSDVDDFSKPTFLFPKKYFFEKRELYKGNQMDRKFTEVGDAMPTGQDKPELQEEKTKEQLEQEQKEREKADGE